MQMRDILGFFLIPLLLLGAAWLINACAVWSFLANLTFPWLCTALAVSLLILGSVCLILQVPPASVPPRVAVLVVLGILGIFGVGMVVDLFAYAEPADWLASLGEWVGLAVILSGVFALPRGAAGT